MEIISQINSLQKQASDPNNSAWVFASAGSGKTKILVDRVLRLLLNKVNGDKILCITFTKVATIEMKERINKILASWVILDDEKLSAEIFSLTDQYPKKQDLQYARTLFTRSLDGEFEIKIQTIHAFCQNIIKIFPFEVGISPNFEILDEKGEKSLLHNAKNEIFLQSKFDVKLNKNITYLTSIQSEESFSELLSNMLSEKEKISFLKIKYRGIENLIQLIAKELLVEKFSDLQEINDIFLEDFDFSQISNIIENLENAKKSTDLKTLSALKEFVKIKDFEICQSLFFTKEFKPKSIKSILTKDFEQYHDFIIALQNKFYSFFDLVKSYKIYLATSSLLRFIDLILEKYSSLKKEKSVLDYNDLIIKTSQLLENNDYKDWVKFRMDGFYDHILVDESQDTNDRQWFIIKSLTEDFFSGESSNKNNRSLFIIGDDKQSIYSFQGAKPNISHEIFEYYYHQNQNIKKIELENSFRSLSGILKFVDNIFQNNESFQKIGYKNHKAIRKGEAKIEIWPAITAPQKENSDSWQNAIIKNNSNDFCAKEEMAQRIVKYIKSWVNKREITDIKGNKRQINYGDIMILLRKRSNNFNKILQQKLIDNSIPFRGVTKIRFSSNLIIQDLISILRFVLLPEDDLNLASLLKTPFFDFDEEKLFDCNLLKNQQKISLFAALNSDDKYQNASNKLKNIIELSQNLQIYEFYFNIINEEIRNKYLSYYGENSLLIIEQFLLEIINFSSEKLTNLQKFYDYILTTDPEISIDESNKNSVFISTIHSAKGLQSPIVILPDCCFAFNKSTTSKETLMWVDIDNEKLPIWYVRKHNKNRFIDKVKQQKIQEHKEEYWRLFYVALTRAENELYISGFGQDNDKDSWYNIALESIDLS